ncbi:MAG: transglutaminase-like cysteine peptidase [Pseudomonadales bacterium]|nr:transglutaminase-like cysteine peptidase [Pseudomonadales bacterium]
MAVEVMPVSSRLAAQLQQQYGDNALRRIAHWQNLIERNQQISILDKLKLVNRFFNSIQFVNDQDHWQTGDYWATPVELLASNGGDCEDFAIAKYFTLRAMGVPVAQLRLTYVKAIELDRAHMVLTYAENEGEDPLVLDNLKNQIMSASSRTDLDPVYSFNAEGLWLAKQRGEADRLGNGNDVTLWRELRVKIDLERVLAQDYN